MGQTLRTKLRIGASVLFASGFWDAVLGRFVWSGRRVKGADAPPVADSFVEGNKAAWRDLAGALHVHSTYSDGASDIPTVMEAAREAGVDFLLLTDHNTQRPLRDGWEARYSGKPLLLIGTEITVEQGAFLLALEMPPSWEPTKHQPPQVAIDEVQAQGGVPLVSLPFDVKHPWTAWDTDGFAGLEVVNLSTLARRHINIPSLLWILPLYYSRGSMSAIRAMLTRPDASLSRWDDLIRERNRPIVGIGALDAHALMKIGKKKHPIPSYTDSFRALTTHVLLPTKHTAGTATDTGDLPHQTRTEIYQALRLGRCHIGYDCLGDSSGFQFVGVSGGQCHAMGETLLLAPNGTGAVLYAAVPPASRTRGLVLLRLLRDGALVASGTNQLSVTVREPGAYRVEAFRYRFRLGPLHVGTRLWVLTNPIYVR